MSLKKRILGHENDFDEKIAFYAFNTRSWVVTCIGDYKESAEYSKTKQTFVAQHVHFPGSLSKSTIFCQFNLGFCPNLLLK